MRIPMPRRDRAREMVIIILSTVNYLRCFSVVLLKTLDLYCSNDDLDMDVIKAIRELQLDV